MIIAAAALDELDRSECSSCQWSIYVDGSVQGRRYLPVVADSKTNFANVAEQGNP